MAEVDLQPTSGGSNRSDGDATARALALLDHNRIMCVATVRSDGWPQATTVGFVHDDFVLYFCVSSTSQKFRNIERDPRISIAIAQEGGGRDREAHGLSMAARAAPVIETREVERVNDLIASQRPGETAFAPRSGSAVLLRATPKMIFLTDEMAGPGQQLPL